MNRVADLKARPRQQIRHVRLVLEDEQRDDIAVRRQILRRVKPVGHGHQFGAIAVPRNRIAHVPHRARVAGHIPPAPALGELTAMVADVSPVLKRRHPAALGRDAAHHNARHPERGRRLMALQAGIAPLKARPANLVLVERIEDHALLRILDGQLHHIAALHIAHRDFVVVVERSRGARGNARRLKAGFRKHQHLRLAGHTQRLQHPRQVAKLRVKRQLHLAGGQAPVQLRDGVVAGVFVVVDGRMIEGCHKGTAEAK